MKSLEAIIEKHNSSFIIIGEYFPPFILLLFLIRLAVPYVNYLLFPALTVAAIFSIYKLINEGKLRFVKNFIVITSSLLVSIIILLFNYFFKSNFHKILTIEILHSLSSFVVLVFLMFSVENKYKLVRFFKRLSNLIIIFSGIIGLAGITKLFFQFKDVLFKFLDIAGYPKGTSLTVDSNFFSLFMVFGIIFLLIKISSKLQLLKSIAYQFILFILTTNVLLSVSRRGLLIASLTICIILFLWFLSFLFKRILWLKHIRNNTSGYIIFLIISFSFSYYFLFLLTPLERNLSISNSTFTRAAVEYITSLVHKSQSIFSDSITFYDVRDKLWKDEFDSRYPHSGWGTNNYSPVNEITGRKSDIVPEGSIGYKLDKTVNTSTWNGNAYSYTKIFNGILYPGRRYTPSVYCYVSEDFNGDWVRISAQGKRRGIIESYYDLDRREEWQKLQLSFEGDSTPFEVYLYLTKGNSLNFDSLKGYVVFASPSIDSVEYDPKIPLSWADESFQDVFPLYGKGNEKIPSGTRGYLLDNKVKPSITSNGAIFYSNALKYKTIKNTIYESSVYAYVSEDFSGDNVRIISNGKIIGKENSIFNLTRKGEWQKLSIVSLGTGNLAITNLSFSNNGRGNFNDLNGYVIFAYPDNRIIEFDSKNPKNFLFDQKYETEFPIIGQNAEIVPEGTVGFSFDNSSPGKIWKYLYFSSYAIQEKTLNNRDSVKATVYCYVSNDFNGNQARLELKGNIKGTRFIRYDMKKKGTWQKLEIKVLAEKGIIQNILFFAQKDVQDYSNLMGKVIFASPELFVKRNTNWIKVNKLYSYQDQFKDLSISKASIIPISSSLNTDTLMVGDDNEDGYSYIPSKNSFSGPRIDRWRYAIYLFTSEYSIIQKIFGGGFEHTSNFAVTFNMDEGYDYPHNPLLSVLLYSGIVGVLAYLWLLFKVISLYWLYRKDYWPWFLCFLTSFFYSFFSANSPFDPAVMALFMVLPFAIHFIHSKDKNETTKD